MQDLRGKKLVLLGFTLFSMFFGAGNLIFPPHLGAQAGANLWPAFAGFAVSAIGLPIMGVAAVANAGGLDRLSFWGNADPFNVEPLLFTFLPTWLANGLHVFAQRAIAVYFTARVCSEQLRLPTRWCILAGLVHAGLGYFTVGNLYGSGADHRVAAATAQIGSESGE